MQECNFGWLPITDDNAQDLAAIRTLEKLWMTRARVTGAGLAALARLPNLHVLSTPELEDAGAVALSRITTLTDLTVRFGACNDDRQDRWLGALSQLPRFEALHVLGSSGSNLSDAGAAHAARLRNLRELTLIGCRMTNGGVAAIAGLRELRDLSLLEMPRVTNESIAHLSKLTKLESLALSDLSISVRQG